MDLFSGQYLGNPLSAWLTSLSAFALVLALLYLLRRVVLARLRQAASRTETGLDDFLVDLLYGIRAPEYLLLAFYAASRFLHLSAALSRGLSVLLLAALSFRAALLAQAALSYWLDNFAADRYPDASVRETTVRSVKLVGRTLLWLAVLLFVLSNLGVNVSAALAGLGIGGVAVALAAQAILGDLFNFFVILLDKPFRIGDFVVLDDSITGSVEHIGLKSTRLRSLSGEMIVVCNSKMLTGGLRNYKEMARRRVVFGLGVTYQTGPEKLRRIPDLVREAVEAVPGASFGRSNLKAYGDFSVNFETVYHVLNGDYDLYAAAHEKVLLGIGDRFAGAGIEFAYPTQTLFVSDKRS